MKAIAYYRTSASTKQGDDSDSKPRQQDAVTKYAAKNGYEIVAEYYDSGVSGGDSVWDRPEFSRMLSEKLAGVILVENANRFARDLIVQLTGHKLLKDEGFTLVPVDAPDYFVNETPTAIMVRQILGAVAEFEKRTIVERMQRGRRRVLAEKGWCGGQPPVPEAVRAAAVLSRKAGKSYRGVAADLVRAGYGDYGPQSVKRMCVGE